jgi:hypothetical protein
MEVIGQLHAPAALSFGIQPPVEAHVGSKADLHAVE